MVQPFHSPDGSLRRIRYRGTELGPTEMTFVASVLAEHAARGPGTLFQAAERLCQHYGWHRPNGQPATISCAVFLQRLARAGVVSVPATRVKRFKRHAEEDRIVMLRALGPVPGFPECPPEGALLIRPIVPEERDGFRLHLERYHYLGFTKPAGESICYAALVGEELVALLVWAAAVPRNAARDEHIGWDARQRERRLPWVVSNSRFLVLPWVRVPCLASRVLSANLRRLSRDWEERYEHPVLYAETFVDTARFRGTCYRAANWICVGQTQGWSRTRHAARGFVHHGQPKAVFVRPLVRRAAELLRGEAPLPGERR